MDNDAGFADYLERVRNGSGEAVRSLVDSYSKYVRRAVRRRLGPGMRSRFDSEDFTQAVWASFFRRRAMIPCFANSRHLMRYLARIAEMKVIDEFRRSQTQHNVRREVEAGSSLMQVDAGDPRPSEVVRASDLLQRLLNDPSERNVKVVKLKLEGANHREIAVVMDVDQKTIQRMLRRIERKHIE
jgi:RNA polymerase sigma factor (sigma-70 family)